MKPNTILQRMVVMLITLMCAIGANAQEAYACYTPKNTTLTFYYDKLRSSHLSTYDLNTGTNAPGWLTDNTNGKVTEVVFDPSFAGARPRTTYKWFCNMGLLRTIKGLRYLNTSAVTNMSWMFGFCSSAFLTTLDLSSFKTTNVTDMSNMFSGCSSLTTLDLSSFNTSNVTNMSYMFSTCNSLTTLDLGNFNTSNVTNMSYMFSGCSGLTTLDLGNFNTSNVTNMNSMFNSCRNLQTIYVGSGWSTGDRTLGTKMFTNCTSLVGGMGTKYNADHVDVGYAHIDGGKGNPGYLTNVTSREVYACYTSSNTTLTFYYDAQRSSREGKTYDLNTGTNNPGWVTDNTNANVTKVAFDSSFADARPTSAYSWFQNMRSLETIEGFHNLNTSEVTNMASMFDSCTTHAYPPGAP